MSSSGDLHMRLNTSRNLGANLVRDISGHGSQAETVVLVGYFAVGGVAD